MNRVLDKVWDTKAILNSIDNYERLVLEHDDYYFNMAEAFSTPIKTEQDYRDVMEELRLFVRAQPAMVLADLEPMFALAAEEPVVYQLSAEAQAGAQGAMAGFDFGKLFSFPDSGWLGELVSRVRRDVEFMGTLDLEDYEEMFTDGWPFQASPSDWAIAMLLIWDHTANVIIIALALILLRVMKHFRRKY